MLWRLVGLFVCFVTCVAHAEPEQRPGKTGERFYKYKNASGRVVFTNAAEQVPLEQRPSADVDLSRRSLNLEVGNDFARRIEVEHAALRKTPYCERARQAAATTFLDQLWEEYSALVVAAGVLLVLIVISPMMMRRFGVAGWIKAVSMAIPLVFAVGLVVFALDKTQKSVSRLKSRAEPCSDEAVAALGSGPDIVQRHRDLLDRLKRDMAALDVEGGRVAREGSRPLH